VLHRTVVDAGPWVDRNGSSTMSVARVKKRCGGGRVDGERNEWWRHQRAGIRLWVGSASDFSTTSPTNLSRAGRVVRTSVPEHYRLLNSTPFVLFLFKCYSLRSLFTRRELKWYSLLNHTLTTYFFYIILVMVMNLYSLESTFDYKFNHVKFT
jgi:hypothetical protein